MPSDSARPDIVDQPLVLAGESPSVHMLRRAIEVLAPLDAHLLIYGERGTGRRTCAALLHRQGPRHAQPFHALSLGVLTEEQIAERIFGADGCAGPANQERNATIYLDGIDRLTAPLQARLVARLGHGASPGIRLFGANTTALDEQVRLGRFSGALFSRLGTVRLSVPPLRERREDIAPIADHVLHRWSERHGQRPRHLDCKALAVLMEHAWLGNVEELVRVLEAACAQTRALTITAERIQLVLGRRPRRAVAADIVPLRDVECDYIRSAVVRCGGNQSLAAKRLGISRNTLMRRLRNCDRQRSRAA